MAAITIKFGVQSQVTPLDTASAQLTPQQAQEGVEALRRGAELGYTAEELGPNFVAELSRDVINAAHGGLESMAWLRHTVEEALAGKGFRVEFHGREVKLVLNKPLPSIPAWNPPTQEGLQKFSLLSWTSKMGTPSFSLPAGSTRMGGSCPGANAGQTVVPLDMLRKSASEVREIIQAPVRLTQAICERCVAGDTRILVRGRGLVPIESMVGAGEFEVWSGKAWRTTHAIHTGIKKTWRVETNWGFSARVSEDHELIDAVGEKIRITDVEAGDALAWAPPPTGESPFPAEASLHYVRLTDAYRTQKPDLFPTEWDERVGVLLGYIIGDGSVYTTQAGYLSVSIGKSGEQREELRQIAGWVREWSDTEAQITETAPEDLSAGHLRGQGALVPQQTRVSVDWKLLSLANFVRHCGVDKSDTSSMRVPAAVWTASHAGAVGFLRGLFATDGSVTNSDGKIEVSVASISRPLLADVQVLLASLGIKSTLCPYKKSNEWREREGYHALYKLGINAIEDVRAFATHVGFFARVKQEKLAGLLAASTARVGRARRPVVTHVSATGVEEPVYDLVDVGPELTFVGNGLLHFDCYAEGGQYSTGQVQFAQVLRFAWAQKAVLDGSFVEVMDWAIKNANFYLGAKEEFSTDDLDDDGKPLKIVLERGERDGKKYFRLHDSGDYFSKIYIAAWKEVADRNPDVTFWSPSRVWAVKNLREAVNEINAPRGPDDPRNLVIRPSAYHINEHPPDLVVVDRMLKHRGLGPGWAAGSTAFADTLKPSQAERLGAGNPYNFDCQAYTTDSDKVTCRDAMPPGGTKPEDRGCRACWKYGHRDERGAAPGLIINYTLH